MAEGRVRGILYLLSLLSAVLAMKTKENAFTLPFAIAMHEFFFFGKKAEIASGHNAPRNDKIETPVTASSRGEAEAISNKLATGSTKQSRSLFKRRLLYLLPFALTLLIIPITRMGASIPDAQAYSVTRHCSSESPLNYLFTQFRVIVTYIRLLFLPTNQNFGYDQPVYNSFFNPNVVLSCLFLSLISGAGIYLFFLSKKRPEFRIISFGIFYLFLALSIESSIFPIGMMMCEYRIYLPSIGLFIAMTAAVNLMIGKAKNSRLKAAAASILMLIQFVFPYAAYERNKVWRSKISLWEDVVKKSPDNAIGHNNLGHAFYSEGLDDRAMEQYKRAITLDPDYAEAHLNLGLIYKSKGLVENAIEHYRTALKLKPNHVGAYDNLGVRGGPRNSDSYIRCKIAV